MALGCCRGICYNVMNKFHNIVFFCVYILYSFGIFFKKESLLFKFLTLQNIKKQQQQYNNQACQPCNCLLVFVLKIIPVQRLKSCGPICSHNYTKDKLKYRNASIRWLIRDLMLTLSKLRTSISHFMNQLENTALNQGWFVSYVSQDRLVFMVL